MTALKKVWKKKIYYSYVIGRFSPEVGSKFQYFPIDNWEKDLANAKKLIWWNGMDNFRLF